MLRTNKKRRICITTWYGTGNYGSNLQAIGLSKTLKQLDYEPYFIDKFRVKSFFLKHPVLLYARIINRINREKNKAFFSPVPYDLSPERKNRLDKFKSDNFMTKAYFTSAEWQEDIKDDVIFACGSDILWNPARGYPALNFLDVAYYAGLSRFSYASSIGALELPKKYYRAYKRYLGSMKAVGVREQTVVDMLEPIIGMRPTRVVDPSLLLTTSDWDEFADKAELSVKTDPKGFIVCYFVMNDPRYWEYVKKVEEETGFQIIVLPMHAQDEQRPYSIVLDGTPYEFLWLVKNAEFVLTDSFHACVVSMIYHKEFYLLRRTRNEEDAKYNDFLGRYHLMNRSISDESVFERNPDVDYTFADEQLKKDREFSMEFLKDALEKC